jgi:hypothetical protein
MRFGGGPERAQPVWLRFAIVVGKGDPLAARLLNSGISPRCRPGFVLPNQAHLKIVPERLNDGVERLTATVIDDDHLEARFRIILRTQRLEQSRQLRRPFVRSDDN